MVIYALNLQAEYLVGFTPGTLLCLFVAIVFSGYFIINSEYKKYLIINLSLTSTAFFFNPISIGPNKVESKDYVRDKLVQIESPETLHKVIVIGNGSNQAAMALFSSGIPTINGILYYPQMEFWNKLGVTGDDYNKINRYQHLVFSVGNLTNQMNFLIENPSPDIVRVIFDGKNFNFKNIDAKVIAVREPEVGGLLYNPSIKLFNVVDGWAWFEIL